MNLCPALLPEASWSRRRCLERMTMNVSSWIPAVNIDYDASLTTCNRRHNVRHVTYHEYYRHAIANHFDLPLDTGLFSNRPPASPEYPENPQVVSSSVLSLSAFAVTLFILCITHLQTGSYFAHGS